MAFGLLLLLDPDQIAQVLLERIPLGAGATRQARARSLQLQGRRGAAEGLRQEQHRYRSPRCFQSWPNHLAYAALIEAGLEVMDELNDPIGFWAATTCRWARIVEAPPRFLAPEAHRAAWREALEPADAVVPARVRGAQLSQQHHHQL